MIGRRVSNLGEVERPGDYCGPIVGFTGDKPACFYIVPNHTCPLVHLSHVTFPPHSCRECPDGSLEIRASIGHQVDNRCKDGSARAWHGYLDEGHVWREC